MKKIVVIDGQGGKMGAALVQGFKESLHCQVIAVGANTAATTAMLKAGADAGATGENPAMVNCREADIVAGPIGILTANALYGEITPAMAAAVSECRAQKLLIPVSKCAVSVMGVQELSLSAYVRMAVEQAAAL